MFSTKKGTAATVTASLTLIALLVAAGCSKNDSADNGGDAPPPSPPGGARTATAPRGGDAALVTAGKAVYAANGCARCHSIGGQGGRGGPNLSQVGAGAGHTPEWLAAHIKNPKTHNPSSRMPAFGGKISDKDLLALGAYLASLK